MFYVFRKLHFIRVKETIEETKENKIIRYESTNFTIINFALTLLGPTHEKSLTIILLVVQVIILFIIFLFYFLLFSLTKVFSCSVAFLIRYQLSKLFYD
jgi:hypothetical protein